jgi:Zn-dependent protease
MELFDSIFVIAIIMFSAVIHEVMHGVAADKLGDPTARYAGRLTLNPISHLDPFGSVLLPVLLALSQSPFLFGWAKPVPYNPYNLRKAPRWGEAIVAFAGPASNFAIALTFSLIMRLGVLATLNDIFFVIVVVNVMLGIFNLIPIPPLDGSKILPMFLPGNLKRWYEGVRAQLEHNPLMGMGLVLLVVMLMGGAFGSFVYTIARTLAGI